MYVWIVPPLDAGAVDYVMHMLARVEGMPLGALQAGLDWDWSSFADWLGRLDGHLAINAGFLAGHSTIRRIVMGDAAVGEEATPRQVDGMVGLLRQSGDLFGGEVLGLGEQGHRGPSWVGVAIRRRKRCPAGGNTRGRGEL